MRELTERSELFAPQLGSFDEPSEGSPSSDWGNIRRADRAALSSSAAVVDGRVPIVAAVQSWAERAPHAPAALCAGRLLRYDELEQRSNRLAHALRRAGVAPGSTVAVFVDPCLELLVALLAIFKAGAVYFPIDPNQPAALVRAMCDEARPHLVLTSAARRPELPYLEPLLLDDESAEWLTHCDSAPEVFVSAEAALSAPAYLFYTSGTTGMPKAVLASHGNLAFYLEAARARFGFRSDDVFCSLARYTFSISLFELLSPLYCGASVHLDGRHKLLDLAALADLLESVTVLHAGPSLLAALFRYLREQPSARRFSQIRHVSSGGDMVGPHIVEQLKATFEHAEIYVVYGCTEISCMGCSHRVERERTEHKSLVGLPFPGMTVRLLDDRHRPSDVDTIGEIAFSGAGVTSGYLARPELNAQKFIELDGATYYLTGDLGRWDAAHGLEILGRRDFQVQVRGMRVELAGIEQTVLSRHLALHCVVVAKKFDDDDMRLVAFVVQPRSETSAIRDLLARQLPDYMVPQRIVILPALPLTANGKVDRRALSDMAWEVSDDAPSSAAPDGPVEQQIAAVFAEGLRVGAKSIARDVDFFDLGGHSLLAVIVTRELEKALGRSLPPGILFEQGSVQGLARYASGELDAQRLPVRLSRASAPRRLFMVAGVHVYRALARHLEGTCELYGVFTGCELTLLERADESFHIPRLAAEYIELIRKVQPRGPYYLGGTSFGGIIAYEVAQQLRGAGEQVPFVGLIDAILPEHTLGSWFTRLRRLSPLPLRELVPLVYDRMKVKLLRALGRRRAAEFAQYADDVRFELMEIVRADYQSRSAVGYMSEIRRCEQPLTLVIAGERLRANPHKAEDCGWRRWSSELDLHVVDALHLALLEEPKVQELAAIFARSMREPERAQ